MIPRPKEIRLTEGTAVQGTAVKERVCKELKQEEYRISIASDEIRLEGGGKTALFYARTALEQLRLIYGEELPCLAVLPLPFLPD